MIKILDTYQNKRYIVYIMLRFIPLFFAKYILKFLYILFYKKELNLHHPKTLSEKIQYIKLYNKDNKKVLLSDKIRVKEFIKNNIAELKCAELYQKAKTFREIDFNKLPNSFILKTNNSWSTNVIIENKLELTTEDYNKIDKFYRKVLKINFSYFGFYEMQYSNIPPFVFAEEYLGDERDKKIYEVFCFNGTPEFVIYRYPIPVQDTFVNKQCFINKDGSCLDFYINYNKGEAPSDLNLFYKILDYSKKLSADIDFVRIDFMVFNNQIYFGEMTFTPYSGFYRINPITKDLYYGEKLQINN